MTGITKFTTTSTSVITCKFSEPGPKSSNLLVMSSDISMSDIRLTSELSEESIDEYCRKYEILSESLGHMAPTDDLLNSFTDNLMPLVLREMVITANPNTLNDAIRNTRISTRILLSTTHMLEKVILHNNCCMHV